MAPTTRSLTRGFASRFLHAWLALASLHVAHAQTPATGVESYEDWIFRHSNNAGVVRANERSAGQRLVITAVEGDDKAPRPDSFDLWTEYTTALGFPKRESSGASGKARGALREEAGALRSPIPF